MDGMLSQEEINALLSGIGGDEPEETTAEEVFEMPVLEDTAPMSEKNFFQKWKKIRLVRFLI